MTFATLRGLALLTLATASLAACSSGAGGAGGSGTPAASDGSQAGADGAIKGDVTWSGDVHLTQTVTIAAGAKVTIAPATTITCDDGVAVTVRGALASAGGGAVSVFVSEGWSGIVVAAGGSLALDGVDIENARAAIEVQTGATGARYDRGTIRASKAPFTVGAGATLTTAHAAVLAPLGPSHVQGALTAAYLDYDANGFDGITTESDDATLSIEDSTLHGIDGTTDMIASYTGAASIHVAYTTIEHVHCAFHLERVTSLDVSFVTAQADAYGFMMHGSLSAGTKSIHDSNFASNLEWGIHEEDASINGSIDVSGCYFSANGLGDVYTHAQSGIHVGASVTAPIAAAHPR
jgi:hypothetical protein